MKNLFMVITLVLFSIMGVNDVPQWVIVVSAGIYVCGFFTGIFSGLRR
jgi:hypothetical protein